MDTTNDVVINMINLIKCFKADVTNLISLSKYSESEKFSLYDDGVNYEITIIKDVNIDPNVSLITLIYKQELIEYGNYEFEGKKHKVQAYKSDSFWVKNEYISSFITIVSAVTTLVVRERNKNHVKN